MSGPEYYYDLPNHGNEPVELASEVEIEYPFVEQGSSARVITRPYLIKRGMPHSMPLNTRDNEFNNAFLVAQSDDTPSASPGMFRFDRTFAELPGNASTHGVDGDPISIGSSFTYSFPRWGQPTIRRPFTLSVTSRIILDFFLVGTEGDYPGFEDIPSIVRQRYLIDRGSGFVDDNIVQDVVFFEFPTQPTLTEYKALITNGTYINAEDSQLSQWKGNIYQRKLTQVLPQ